MLEVLKFLIGVLVVAGVVHFIVAEARYVLDYRAEERARRIEAELRRTQKCITALGVNTSAHDALSALVREAVDTLCQTVATASSDGRCKEGDNV